MAASVPCAASRKIRVVGATVDSTAQRATTFPPPLTACFAREASILRIGMDAGDWMPSTTGPSVEQVRTTTSLPSQRASKAILVRSAISEVRPPACSAASSKSARISCWSTGRSGPSICAAASNTAILLLAVCKQPMRTVFIRALSRTSLSRWGHGDKRRLHAFTRRHLNPREIGTSAVYCAGAVGKISPEGDFCFVCFAPRQALRAGRSPAAL